MTNDLQRKLRIGLLLDSTTLPIWLFEMLSRIHRSEFATIELVVLGEVAARESTGMVASGKRWHERALSYLANRTAALYNWVDSKREGYRDAFEPTSCDALLKDALVHELQVGLDDFYRNPEKVDSMAVMGCEIDILLGLDSAAPHRSILQLARYGLWRLQHGCYRNKRGGPAGFWEVYYQRPATGSYLEIRTKDTDDALIAQHCRSGTDLDSLVRNRCASHWNALSMIPRKMQELHELGPELFFQHVRAANEHLTLYSDRIFSQPTAGQSFVFHLRALVRQFVSEIRKRLTIDQWILLYSCRKEPSTSLPEFKRITPPRDRFWADPFVVTRGDDCFVFIEELPYSDQRGIISVFQIGADGACTQPVSVLERPYHLSYPFVFDYEGETYMLPETSENGTVELYKCIDFPTKWTLTKILMKGIFAVDSTLHFHDGKWWMFTNIRETEGARPDNELYLFYADSPLADTWHPHPQNPVVSDASSARPAGKLFYHNGMLYRPSQNCLTRYGYGLNLNHVSTLNTREYSEEPVTRAYPDWQPDVLGVHTFNFVEGLTVSDAFIRRSRYF